MPQKPKSPQEIIQKMEYLKGERSTLETHLEDITQFILPNQTITTDRTPGSKTMGHLFDTTGMMANELLAGSLHGMLTSPSNQFFEFTTGDDLIDEQDFARLWMQDVVNVMHHQFANCNFNTEVHPMYLQLTALGTSPMFIFEDDEFIVRFETKSIKEVLIEEDEKGLVDEVYRYFYWTAAQIVKFFGEEVLSEKMRRAYAKGDMTKYKILHGVYPTKGIAGFRYANSYILEEDKRFLESDQITKGFREFPLVCPRWTKEAGEKYGRGPGMIAYPECRVLNKMMEQTLMGAQLALAPPMQAPDDGFLMPIRIKPQGLNFYRAGGSDRIEPIFKQMPNIDFGFQIMENRQNRVREAFFVDQLQLNPQGGTPMTATEVMQRWEEKQRLLGPMLGRLQHEFLRPMIDRVYAIMDRAGKIPAPPPELVQALRQKGTQLDVRYSSMIARAQKMSEASNIAKFFQLAAPMIELSPEARDVVDSDEGIRSVARLTGLPQRMIRGADAVDSIREDRAEAQRQAVEEAQRAQEADTTQKEAQGMGQMMQMSKRGA